MHIVIFVVWFIWLYRMPSIAKPFFLLLVIHGLRGAGNHRRKNVFSQWQSNLIISYLQIYLKQKFTESKHIRSIMFSQRFRCDMDYIESYGRPMPEQKTESHPSCSCIKSSGVIIQSKRKAANFEFWLVRRYQSNDQNLIKILVWHIKESWNSEKCYYGGRTRCFFTSAMMYSTNWTLCHSLHYTHHSVPGRATFCWERAVEKNCLKRATEAL